MAVTAVRTTSHDAPVRHRRTVRANTPRSRRPIRQRAESVSRRRAADADWLRALITALREMWDQTRRQLAMTLEPQRFTAVLGAACLALECVAVGSMLLA